MLETGEKHISLREAAELSGYSSDYIGQLIRKGKLPGKQVYSSVVWMTTESAIREYVEESKKGKKKGSNGSEVGQWWNRTKNSFFSQMEFAKLYSSVLYGSIAFSLVFSLFLFYILSVNIDRALERRVVRERSNHQVETGALLEKGF